MSLGRKSGWRAIVAAALLIIFCGLAQAEPPAPETPPAGKWAQLVFEPASTTISYRLVGWPHITDGTFQLKSGKIRLDPASARMDGEIVIDAASGTSGHNLRDARMRDDILEAAKFPTITFAPQQVVSHGEAQGDFPVAVRGVMTLHGAPHPITIDGDVRRDGDTVVIHCAFAVPFVAWGLEDPSVLFFTVQKKVEVTVSATARLTWVSP